MALLSEGYGDDDIKELRLNLSEAAANLDPSKLRAALAHIVSQMSLGNSLSALFPELVKICATNDLPSKKLVYMYMAGCACEQPTLTLLAINCLLKDCQDSNPMVRGMALRTLCSLRLPLLMEYIELPLLAGLKDKSAYVRRIAVLGCLKACKLDSSFIKDRNIIDQLCELIADRDNTVMINVLCVLHELQGGLLVTPNIAHALLNRVSSLSEWGQIKALQVLLTYKPANEEEVFDILNLVDGCLRHPNSGVSLGAVHFMLLITKDLPHVNQDVIGRLKGILLSHLGSDQPAFVYASLCHLQWLLDKLPQGISKYYKKFYCKYNEPVYLRCKRIDLLVQLITEANLNDIVGELSAYCIDVSTKFGQHAVRALGAVSQLNPAYTGTCMDALLRLLQLGIDRVSSAVFIEMQELLSLEGRYQDYVSQVLDLIPGCWSNIEHEDGRCAMIWLVGHHGQKLQDAPYLLESAIDNIMEESSHEVKGHLLGAITKLFFTRPAECQDSLATMLQHCIETQKDVFLQERAMLYYQLLHTDVKKAKMVICSSQRLRPPSRSSSRQPSSNDVFNSFRLLLGSDNSSDGMNQPPPSSSSKGYSVQTPSTTLPDPGPSLAPEGMLVDLSLDDTKVQDAGNPDKAPDTTHGLGDTDIHLLPGQGKSSSNDDVKGKIAPRSGSRKKESLTLLQDGNDLRDGVSATVNEDEEASEERKDPIPVQRHIGASDVASSASKDFKHNQSSSSPPKNRGSSEDAVGTLDHPGSNDVENREKKEKSLGIKTASLQEGEMKSGVTFEPCTLSPQEFEDRWMAWTNSETLEVAEKRPSILLERFDDIGFHTMASTPTDSEPWRAFLYAQMENGELFLVEATTHQTEETCSLCIKSSQSSSSLTNKVIALCKETFL
ncbi:AP-4 complex subunit beta-1 [Strongylocentrotus purpuratus]|uniref:AP complex subunit beta n=1 Tax=Strongylocentrotus purpuratus TaxID=7668 RepID=A0A7M7STH0_STRPU|nr:AP-4 complex subunit beta-1 [Strongylocentrotus purpuratus]XP_030829955.1 AP-4 complex subunit beta-1 [Strongylocentrotus purpuratus]